MRNMGNAVTRSIQIKCSVGKAKPPEENGIELSNKTFTVFTLKKSCMLERKCVKSCRSLQWCQAG